MSDSEAPLRIVIDALNKSQAGMKALLDELKGIEKQSDKTNTSLKDFVKDSEKLKSVGDKMTLGVTRPLVDVATAATKLASDLNETRSKTSVIFGEMSADIQAWADGANKNLGQTRKQALDGAADFAIFGKSAGLAGRDLTAFAESNVELAADMASFFNTSPEEAITAIGAAFRGEAEPIRKYGVLINDASLKDEALRQGLIKTTTEALTPQQRVLAAQALILKQTAAAQGDFARTSDGLANQTRIMRAQLEDALTTLGEKFLPIAIKSVGIVRDLLTAFEGLSPELQTAIVSFGAIAAAAGPVMSIGGRLIWMFGTMKTVLAGLGASTGPLALVIAGLAAIVAYLDRVSKATQKANEDLIAMSRSGDVLDQAAASTEILVNGQERLKKALDATHEKIKSSAKNYADYKSSITATAKAAGYQINANGDLVQVMYGLGGRIERVVQSNYLLTESQHAATQGAYGQAGALDESARALQREAQAKLDAAARAEQLKPTMMSLSDATQIAANTFDALKDAQERNQKAAEDFAARKEAVQRALQEYREGISETIGKIDAMARSLMNMTDAQAKQALASNLIEAIKQAQAAGKITQDEAIAASNTIMLKYGLASEKTLAMASAQQAVVDAFLRGQVPLDTFVNSADKIPQIASDGKVSFVELKTLGIEPVSTGLSDLRVYAQILKDAGITPLTGEIKTMQSTMNTAAKTMMSDVKSATDTIANEWNKVPRDVTTTYHIVTQGSIPSGGSTSPATAPGGKDKTRAQGGPVSEGWWYLHNDEYVLSASMRAGRTPVPAEAIPSSGLIGNRMQMLVGPINVYGAPGMDVQELARAVKIELGREVIAAERSGMGYAGL